MNLQPGIFLIQGEESTGKSSLALFLASKQSLPIHAFTAVPYGQEANAYRHCLHEYPLEDAQGTIGQIQTLLQSGARTLIIDALPALLPSKEDSLALDIAVLLRPLIGPVLIGQAHLILVTHWHSYLDSGYALGGKLVRQIPALTLHTLGCSFPNVDVRVVRNHQFCKIPDAFTLSVQHGSLQPLK